ncbi:MAG: hypothetical protein K6E59_03930 [Bacilli bacterium]|nr:hypothetical protein [Bacilli bacterium]
MAINIVLRRYKTRCDACFTEFTYGPKSLGNFSRKEGPTVVCPVCGRGVEHKAENQSREELPEGGDRSAFLSRVELIIRPCKAQCPYCFTDLEYDCRDVKMSSSSGGQTPYIPCPVCGHQVPHTIENEVRDDDSDLPGIKKV